jgi:hypothetical protein
MDRIACIPAMITRAALIVGRRAGTPGKGAFSFINKPETMTPVTPTQPSVRAASLGILSKLVLDTASRPPRASSQARVGSEKNAQGAFDLSNQRASAKDVMPIASNAMRMFIRGLRALRVTSSTIAGQNM